MVMLFLQTLVLMAVAFVVGCLAGYWLKSRFTASKSAASETSAARAEAGANGVSAAPEPAASSQVREPSIAPDPDAGSAEDPAVATKAAQPAGDAPPAPATKSGTSSASRVTGKKKTGKARASASPKPVATDPAENMAADAVKAAPGAAKAPAPAGSKQAAAASSTTAASGAKARRGATKTGGAAPASKAKSKSAGRSKAKTKPAAAAVADDLKQIKGIGPQLEAKLNAAGINSFAQIASWTRKEQAEFGEKLFFQGRVERDEWVAQAKVLAKGGTTEFSTRVAKGDVPSSGGGKRTR